MNIKLIFSLILAGLAVIFMIQNFAIVEVHFLFWSFAMSRALFILMLLAIGIGVGWLLHSFLSHRKQM